MPLSVTLISRNSVNSLSAQREAPPGPRARLATDFVARDPARA